MIGRVRLPKQHTGQQLVRNESRRYNFLCCGRRWRKSSLLMSLGVEAALTGKSVLCGSPTYDQVRILWGYTKRAVGEVARFNATRLEAEFPNGGRIIYRSLDNPDNVRGHSADLVLLDEAPLLKPEVWHEALLPMLVDSGGDAWLAGTPNGRNWYWVEHQLEGEARQAWQIPTVGCSLGGDGNLIEIPNKYSNPHITFTEMAGYYERVPQSTFKQEILAEFVQDSSGVFRNVRKCATAKHYDHRQGSWKYVIGVDLARTIDFTVLTVLDITNKQVVHIDRFNQINYTTQEDRLVALYEKFKPEMVLVESNAAGEPFCEQLERRNLPIKRFLTTNSSKKMIIEALALAFERDDLKIPNNKGLINELLSFEGEKLPTGRIRYAAPKGLHDDYVMSLALAWEALKQEGHKRIEYSEITLPW